MELRAGMLVYHKGNDPRIHPIYEILEQDFGPCAFTHKPRKYIKARYFMFYAPGISTLSSHVGYHLDANSETLVEVPEMILLARIAAGEENALDWKGAQP